MKARFMFRIFDTNRNVMLYEDSKDLDMEKYYGFEEYWCAMIKMPLIAIKDFFDYGFNKEYILMQSTGLKDKNGKLIYEGDVVHINKFNCDMFVVWNKEQALFELRDCWCKFEGANIRYGFDDREIIGNIYQNPELLEE